MTWETPEIIDVRMDSEIGSYQEDGNDERDPRPVIAPQAE